jgi:hypothetical protein
MLRNEEYGQMGEIIYGDLYKLLGPAAGLMIVNLIPRGLCILLISSIYKRAYETGYYLGREMVISKRFENN